MKKSVTILVICCAFFIIICLGLYLKVIINKKSVEKYTYAYIDSQGYSSEGIQNINIEHSYLNKILGYNEWRISVIFKEKPDFKVWLSYKNNEIMLEGVTSDSKMEKEDFIEYNEQFKNGTLFENYKIENVK